MFDFNGFFDDLEVADFARVGGSVGCIEDEMNERIRIERQMEREIEGDDEVTNESPEELS